MHLRHLVGGRARGDAGGLQDERFFTVTFPERRGALRAFLNAVSPAWNVTLFHYRDTGNRASNVLLGVQLPEGELPSFRAAVAPLEPDGFAFGELRGDERAVFNMFIQ